MMTVAPQDARIRELRLLATIDRMGLLEIEHTQKLDLRERSMIIELIHEGLLNGPRGSISYSDRFVENRENASAAIDYSRWDTLARLMAFQPITLWMTHKGRVRLAELEQALKTGRDRDPTETVFSKRHLEKDLTIALASARPESPVTVCMLDMNGLKQINDFAGHKAGDQAIETYLKAIAVFIGDDAEGYRGDGGDELIVVMRGTALHDAVKTMRLALTQLSKEKVTGVPFLSASCGVTTTVDPNTDARDLLKRVDTIQYRAKEESKKRSQRPSVIAVNDEPAEVLAEPK